MKGFLILGIIVLVTFTTTFAADAPLPVSLWAEDVGGVAANSPDVPTGRDYATVRIADMTSYIRYLFQHKQAVILPQDNEYWFFFAYNDNDSHVETVIFEENQLSDPASWIVQDIYEWTGDGILRYICPTAYWDGALWFPQATFNAHSPATNWYMIDEGGLGASVWSDPYDVLGPIYDYYLPLTETGPGNIVYLDGQARDVADDSHIFKSFDGGTGTVLDPPGEVMIFPASEAYGPDPVYSQGYENSQLLYRDGTIIIATGGYRDEAFSDPENPLLVVYKASEDAGNTWSENIWLDQAVVPDMPGGFPGIAGHWSNSFFDGLIEDDGDLHFACVVVDSGCSENESYIHGIYDLHQEAGTWIASLICDGTYQITPDSIWDPRTEILAGDSWMHSPSLAEGEDGTLFAAWADIGYYHMNIWLSRSHDGGNTWVPAIRVTDTEGVDEYFPRLVPTATDQFVYILTMYNGENGPMDMIQVPVDFEYVPVELSSLTARVVEGSVLIEWATQSEQENFGFNLERASAKRGPYVRLNQDVIPGAGTTNVPQSYSYEDDTTKPGNTYWYRLEDISLDGESTFHGPVEAVVPDLSGLTLDIIGMPGSSDLEFTMRFENVGQASLALYDVSGRLVTKLWEGEAPESRLMRIKPGATKALPTGSYIAILTQGRSVLRKKVVILR